jgi:hypothetical protein
MSPTNVNPNGKIPIEVWTGKKPTFHIWEDLEVNFLHWSRKTIKENWIITLLNAYFLGTVMKTKPINSWENMTKVYWYLEMSFFKK